MPDDVPIENKRVSASIASAQSQVEAQNFETRKNILKYDDVMNRQRHAVYGDRRKVLEGADVESRLRSTVDTVVEQYVARGHRGVRRGLGPGAAVDQHDHAVPGVAGPRRVRGARRPGPPDAHRRLQGRRAGRVRPSGGRARRGGDARAGAARAAHRAGPQVARAPLRDGLPARGHRPAGDGPARPAGGVPARGRRHVQRHDGSLHGGGRRLRLPPRGRGRPDVRRSGWSPDADGAPVQIAAGRNGRQTGRRQAAGRVRARPGRSRGRGARPRRRRQRGRARGDRRRAAGAGADRGAGQGPRARSAAGPWRTRRRTRTGRSRRSASRAPRPTTRTRGSAATHRVRAARGRSSRCATGGPAPSDAARRIRLTVPEVLDLHECLCCGAARALRRRVRDGRGPGRRSRWRAAAPTSRSGAVRRRRAPRRRRARSPSAHAVRDHGSAQAADRPAHRRQGERQPGDRGQGGEHLRGPAAGRAEPGRHRLRPRGRGRADPAGRGLPLAAAHPARARCAVPGPPTPSCCRCSASPAWSTPVPTAGCSAQLDGASLVPVFRATRDRRRVAPHNVFVDLRQVARTEKLGKAQPIGWTFADKPSQRGRAGRHGHLEGGQRHVRLRLRQGPLHRHLARRALRRRRQRRGRPRRTTW